MSDQVSPPPGYVMITAADFVELVKDWIDTGYFRQAGQLMDITEGDWSSGLRRPPRSDMRDDGQAGL